MAWSEEKRVSKEDIYTSTYHTYWNSAQIEFEIRCIFSCGEWRWMLYLEQFGIADKLFHPS